MSEERTLEQIEDEIRTTEKTICEKTQKVKDSFLPVLEELNAEKDELKEAERKDKEKELLSYELFLNEVFKIFFWIWASRRWEAKFSFYDDWFNVEIRDKVSYKRYDESYHFNCRWEHLEDWLNKVKKDLLTIWQEKDGIEQLLKHDSC